MKRDFDAVLRSFDGKPFKDGDPKFARNEKGGVKVHEKPVLGPDGEVLFEAGSPVIEKEAPDLTLKKVAIHALGSTIRGDDEMSGAKKLDLYHLASRISKGGLVEVSAEEVSLLKERIAKTHTIFAAGAAMLLLEQDPEAATAA